jgi:hypothetical protein
MITLSYTFLCLEIMTYIIYKLIMFGWDELNS